jgi:hypothetical protein
MPETTVDKTTVVDDIRDGEAPEEQEQEDVQESEEEETTEDAETETQEQEQEEDTEEVAEDEPLDFDEWIKQWDGMPENIKSDADLAEAYLSMLKEMKSKQSDAHKLQQIDSTLRARGYGSVDELLTGQGVPQNLPPAQPAKSPGTEEPYFDTKAASAYVESMAKSGNLGSDETAQSYRAVANLVDNAYGAQFAKNEQALLQTWQTLNHVLGKVRDLEWSALPEKVRSGVDRKSVDELMKNGAFQTYEQAVRFQFFDKPDLLTQLAQQSKDEGKKAGLKKRRQKAIRRSKTRTQGGGGTFNYDRYILSNGDWNQELMNRELSSKQRKDMTAAYLKEHFNE